MAETTIKLPDGKTITIEHGEDATKEELINYAKSQYKPKISAATQDADNYFKADEKKEAPSIARHSTRCCKSY